MLSFSHNNTKKTIIYLFIIGLIIGACSINNITYLDDGIINADVPLYENMYSKKIDVNLSLTPAEMAKVKNCLNQQEYDPKTFSFVFGFVLGSAIGFALAHVLKNTIGG